MEHTNNEMHTNNPYAASEPSSPADSNCKGDKRSPFKIAICNEPEEIFWEDKKHYLGLPLSFTKYQLYADRLTREKGIFDLKQDEIPLFRVMDVSLKQSITQIVTNTGDIYIYSTDASSKTFVVRSVRYPKKVLRYIKDLVDKERAEKNIAFMDAGFYGV